MKDRVTRIFLDGGDPEETKAADELLRRHGIPGIEGQTTNPSLIVKNLSKRLGGRKVSEHEAESEYRTIVREIAKVTAGPISIQVTGSPGMSAETMLTHARERMIWTPHAVIKFPCTPEGLKAVNVFAHEGSVNVTLAFSQEQAAAVCAATRGIRLDSDDMLYEVFVSPFVGRLDDRGENGMDIVSNILTMYRSWGIHQVKVLAASVRTIGHLLFALHMGSDVVTVPFSILKQWADGSGCRMPESSFIYDVPGLTPIPYREISPDRSFWEYDISHPLTEAGVSRFWDDWRSVLDG